MTRCGASPRSSAESLSAPAGFECPVSRYPVQWERMLKARTLMTVLALAVALPAAAEAQIPSVPDLPELPPVPGVPDPPPVPVPVPDLPDLPPIPVPVPEVPDLPLPPAPGGGGSGGGGGGGGAAPAPSGSGGGARPRCVVAPPAVPQPAVAVQRRRAVATDPPPLATLAPARRLARRSSAGCGAPVARLSGCLDELSGVQQRVLELRAGVGSASPRTRQGVARVLDIRVQRVRRIERSGLRRARALDRADACGGVALGGAAPVLRTGSLAGTSGGGDAPGDESLGGGTPAGGGDDSTPNGGSGDVRGETATPPPPALGGPRESPEGTSLWVAVGLMLLAALAGFATPALRDRLPGGSASRAG